jgi:siderophore synthetase component
VHPQVVEECRSDPYLQRTIAIGRSGPSIRVSPSASTRTLFVLDHPSLHALKVHFPFRVSRYGRRMRGEVIEQAVAVSSALQRWSGGGDPRFAFLREVIGVTHPPLEIDRARGENWGYLVRDLTPFPFVADERQLIPGFALYGKDANDAQARPLLLDLADERDPVTWTLENVILPTLRHWVACYRDLGFILEPHGQNLLLEVNRAGAVTRLVHRDLSVGIDMRRRRHQGLTDAGLNGYNRFEDGLFASIAFDRFMGTHFFEFLVRPLIDLNPRWTMEDFRSVCRAEFDHLFPDHQRYLPRTVHYFSEERDPHGKPLYRDTGHRPVWRP